jgi:hypothetical protein
MTETITIDDAAVEYEKNRATLARKIRRAGIRPLFTTRSNPGSPKGHYRKADIEQALIDRRYGPRQK